MSPLVLSISSNSRLLPMSSVAFLLLRPPRAPPSEPPSPPTPPEPPDPPDPQICFFLSEALAQLLSSSSFKVWDSLVLHLSSIICDSLSPARISPLPTKFPFFVRLMLPNESSFATWFEELGTLVCTTSLTTVDAVIVPPPMFPQGALWSRLFCLK
ncbi:uncharacterized protein LOC17880170 isoform X2 [Capsella rubella]|uniref:uncharacterized protein LOC17880170 isoform X2 n=1 Tax=Capsella rubella TaxID=81985 RepID=UPI000CD52EF2|nr:uncharacterized protein LOC17880170 isoform X2 [Capsella rubella]